MAFIICTVWNWCDSMFCFHGNLGNVLLQGNCSHTMWRGSKKNHTLCVETQTDWCLWKRSAGAGINLTGRLLQYMLPRTNICPSFFNCAVAPHCLKRMSSQGVSSGCFSSLLLLNPSFKVWAGNMSFLKKKSEYTWFARPQASNVYASFRESLKQTQTGK